MLDRAELVGKLEGLQRPVVRQQVQRAAEGVLWCLAASVPAFFTLPAFTSPPCPLTHDSCVISLMLFHNRNKEFDGGILTDAYIPIIPNTTARLYTAKL